MAAQAPQLPDHANLWHTTLGWQPSANQLTQFQQLYEQILIGNAQLNLTRITEPTEFWEKHLWDSLSGIKRFLQPEPQNSELAQNEVAQNPEATQNETGQNEEQNQKHRTPIPKALSLIDIGTGAGFPGLPIAIAQPTWRVTLLDSTRKKIQFVHQLLPILSLKTVRTVVDRVEQVGRQSAHRGRYDRATIRAVAAATVCAEYALPLLKVGGVAVLYRGHWTPEETESLQRALEELGGELMAIDAFQTPLTGGDRHAVYLRKTMPTPDIYPRAVGVPAQSPLA